MECIVQYEGEVALKLKVAADESAQRHRQSDSIQTLTSPEGDDQPFFVRSNVGVE